MKSDSALNDLIEAYLKGELSESERSDFERLRFTDSRVDHMVVEHKAFMQQMAEYGWAIETYHRGIKQCTEVERCQARSARAQRNHIGLALRAFLRLEWHLFSTGVSWLNAKAAIIRDAVRAYLTHPSIRLPTA